MKTKKRFVCKECGYTSPAWIGKCPECLSWNSFLEEIIQIQKTDNTNQKNKQLIKNTEINLTDTPSILSLEESINSFFGEGLVLGSVILLSGEPGIGKSTFLLFLSKNFSSKKIFYFSGEESINQLKRRIDRLNIKNDNLFISNEVEIEKIILNCTENKPDIIFIDSIQTSYSSNIDSNIGTISQIKGCTEKITNFSKEYSIPIFIIGHVTKSGDIAGPKIIEHIVDMVISFESNNQNQYRILRAMKNRFGSVDEILIFEMKEDGLLLIQNPTEFFIVDDLNSKSIAKCKTVILEGQRPLIVEVEALVVPSVFSNPRRFSEGVDIARINRITAILNKHLNENLNNYDIYFNISGGIRTKDVGLDLAIAVSIFSSKNKKEINNDSIYIGELSLTGKVRNISRIEKRIKISKQLGIKNIFIPDNNEIKNEDGIFKISDLSKSIEDFYN